jgi:hypothetical protein
MDGIVEYWVATRNDTLNRNFGLGQVDVRAIEPAKEVGLRALWEN